MNDLNRNSERLSNIHAIEPILNALRLSSLARWRSALKKLSVLKIYRQHLDTILAVLASSSLDSIKQATISELYHQNESSIFVLLAGSERRLCGDFNTKLVAWVNNHLTGENFSNVPLELIVTGKPLFQLLQNQVSVSDTVRMSLLDMSILDQQARDLARSWFRRYIEGDVRAVFGVYNQYAGIGRNKIVCESLLPSPCKHQISTTDYEPIIETNLQHLIIRVVEQLFTVQIVMLLTESTATENAVRYQIMESAMDNVGRLVEELEIAVHVASRRSITRELQTLMSASGLYR